jgi:hypothetical protein
MSDKDNNNWWNDLPTATLLTLQVEKHFRENSIGERDCNEIKLM